MKMVIDIPEVKLKALRIGEKQGLVIGALQRAVLDGTPLPKGHGRLIDAKQAEERLRQAFDEHEGYNSLARYIVRNPSETPTIIEADKGGEQE